MKALLLLLAFAFRAEASAPQLKTQAPGFHRSMVGDIEVTTLFDGFFPLKPAELLSRIDAKAKQRLKDSYQGDVIPTSVNAFLVNTGSRLVLVDAGCGNFYGPAMGRVAANLKASGYAPEQVDEIVITHMHSDHLGGVVQDGKAAFPNAVLRIESAESDYWLNPENAKKGSELMKSHFKNAAIAVAPYQASGKFKPFHGKTEITPGLTAIPNDGHTPGHTAYEISSKGKKLLLLGDTFHVEPVQFGDPSNSMVFDDNRQLSAQRRKQAFENAAKEGYLIGAAHLPFPGIGHVGRDGKGAFRYLPSPYAPVE